MTDTPPPPVPTEADKAAMALEARRLLRAAAVATLATQHAGQPFASLVTPATTPGCEVLMWLSTLSEHTRHLLREPRCALMVQGPPAGANPQTAPRLTVTGLAERVAGDGGALKGRWLSRHPYAELYAGFADFSLFRLVIQEAAWVGGFAMARRFRAADFLPDAEAVAAIAAAEADILNHVNADHADAVAAIAHALGGPAGEWRMASLDTDGCDLAAGEWVLRFCFGRPVREPDGVRRELILAARTARGA